MDEPAEAKHVSRTGHDLPVAPMTVYRFDGKGGVAEVGVEKAEATATGKVFYAVAGNLDRARLREATARTTRLGDELQSLAERAALVHEQILDMRGERMNRTMLVLASVTVVAMPMTVVSGLLGMNVSGIPFAQNPEAFWIVVLGLAAVGTAMVWFMRARKWL